MQLLQLFVALNSSEVAIFFAVEFVRTNNYLELIREACTLHFIIRLLPDSGG